MIAVLLGVHLVAGCAGVIQQPYYEGSAGQLTDDMVPVRDEANKFNFLLPPGWTIVTKDETLPEFLEVPRDMSSETGTAVYRKGDRGALVVWCRPYEQTEYNIEQSLYSIAPSCQLALGPLQLKTEGSDPMFRRYDSFMVDKGERKGFSFFFGTKSRGILSLYDCNYVVVARSSSIGATEEIENDFIAVLRSLRN